MTKFLKKAIGFKPEPTIVDKVNLNNFGIMFHDAKVIEDMQELSGMSGLYTKEYQVHYTSFNGKLVSGNQSLEIAIPLVFFNYEQDVGGASVSFNLINVATESERTMPLAMQKVDEFTKTDMFKYLSEDMGIKDWRIMQMNSIHAHPNGINSFSGVDLKRDITRPGVCFPLSEGKDISNYASIIQHINQYAELIHTEYRVFNGTPDSDKVYEKGRAITLIRGFTPPQEPEPEPEVRGPFDILFDIPVVVKQKAFVKQRDSKMLINGMPKTDKIEDVAKELMALWVATDYKIDTSNIFEKNVIIQKYVAPKMGYGYGYHKDNYDNDEQEDWFGRKTGYATHKNKKKSINIKKSTVEYLMKSGYSAEEVDDMDAIEAEEIMVELMNIDLEEEEEIEEMKQQLIDNSLLTEAEIKLLDDDDIIQLHKQIYLED